MKTYIAYIRVSTARQTQGASLSEQRSSIERYAKAKGLRIDRWYEEIRTAAKGGRSVFQEVILDLERHPAHGLIIHKIDRGARNLKDWATLGELIDRGIDVRFAHDDLDMETRGGRLSADIQAVIAADYIRNLREEVKKGMYGRLRQGLYPLGAPLGYLDRGGGRAKVPDPVKAPLIVMAFQLYATGEYTLRALSLRMAVLGLTTHRTEPVSPSRISKILRNSFYAGTCLMRGTTYPGIHQPLVEAELFAEVQRRLRKRRHVRKAVHVFRYAGRLTHDACGYTLSGERQKGHVYYRCHRCRGVSLREEQIDREMEGIDASEPCRIDVKDTFVSLRFLRPNHLLAYQKFDYLWVPDLSPIM